MVNRGSIVVPAALAALLALVLDLRALLPGLAMWDTAEFQAIGPVLGIAHPTGFPTYTLLAWVASVVLQPFGDPALRANLLSALLAAGAVGLTAASVVLLTRRPLLGLAAGAALATAPIAWSVGLRADAHALHFFFVALLLLLLIRWSELRERGTEGAGRWLVAAAGAYGLSLGNHALTLLLAPGIGLFVIATSPGILRRPRLLGACIAALTLTTAAVYAYLPVRSAMDPPLDYANPETWEAFRYVVLGEQFRGTFSGVPDVPAVVDGLRVVAEQLGIAAVLGLLGAAAMLVRRPRLLLLLGSWFVLTVLFAISYINAAIDRYYLGPLLVTIVSAALGADWIWRSVEALRARASAQNREPLGTPRSSGRVIATVLGLALILPSLATIPVRLRQVDASEETYGREWVETALAAFEPGAVVVSWWSFSTPLWYAQYVEGRRLDLLLLDDRTLLDRGIGTVPDAVDSYLGERPVYVIRLARDLPPLRERYRMAQVPGFPGWGPVWRIEALL